MNPFDLRGPQFLLFYVALSVLVIVVARWLRDQVESGPVPQVSLDDPYFFAYLRGGMNEALRVAIVVLLDRGSLVAEGVTVRKKDVDPGSIQHPVEREVLSFFSTPQAASDALKLGTLGSSTYTYEARAEELGLMPDEQGKRRRWVLFGIAAFGLGVVSLTKIGIALARGRTNILFLIILAGIVEFVLMKVVPAGITAKGKALLRDMRTLFGDLNNRRPLLQPGSGTKEVAWLVAVFGLIALPLGGFPDVKTLFPRSMRTSAFGFDTYGGSSCGTVTSCGAASSCGSGCGGGGCGGGCGGCGS